MLARLGFVCEREVDQQRLGLPVLQLDRRAIAGELEGGGEGKCQGQIRDPFPKFCEINASLSDINAD